MKISHNAVNLVYTIYQKIGAFDQLLDLYSSNYISRSVIKIFSNEHDDNWKLLQMADFLFFNTYTDYVTTATVSENLLEMIKWIFNHKYNFSKDKEHMINYYTTLCGEICGTSDADLVHLCAVMTRQYVKDEIPLGFYNLCESFCDIREVISKDKVEIIQKYICSKKTCHINLFLNMTYEATRCNNEISQMRQRLFRIPETTKFELLQILVSDWFLAIMMGLEVIRGQAKI